MAKLKSPFLAFKAAGRLGKLLSYRPRGRQTIAETRPIPPDAKSPAQLSWRHMYQKATALWNALSAAEKQEWETNARPKHMTGYAWFMSQCLKPNPGIYLPLQGGTMQGNINMATHKILDLPAPTANKEPTRKADLGAHAALTRRTHGVGDDYIAKAVGEQYVAVRRETDTMLGPAFLRAVDNSYIWISGGQTKGAGLYMMGKNHAGNPGWFFLEVPNAAKTESLYPVVIQGAVDNPLIFPYVDNQTDLGLTTKKWRHVYTHGLDADNIIMQSTAIYRAINDGYLKIMGGLVRPAELRMYGRDNLTWPGGFAFSVPNAAGTGVKYPIWIQGKTDNPIVDSGEDNETDLGSPSYKWRHVYTHGLTHDQLCVTDKKCSKCGKEFQVGDAWAYSVIKLSGDFTVKQPRIVKKRHNPDLPATAMVHKLNEWTGEYEDITRPVMVKIKRQHYYEEDGQVIQEEIEEEVENEYDAIDGEIETPADGFMTCAPVCRLCFLKV